MDYKIYGIGSSITTETDFVQLLLAISQSVQMYLSFTFLGSQPLQQPKQLTAVESPIL